MGNLISSFFSGLGKVVNDILGSPLDFLSGKSCSSVCGSTWDFICYIENFCVAHLLKLALVSVLFYFVLLFFYSLYKLGICQCIIHTLCKMLWACFATLFSSVEFCCTFLCYKLPSLKRKHIRHKRDIEELNLSSSSDDDGEDVEVEDKRFSHRGMTRSPSKRWRDYRGDQLRRSLRARSHRVKVGIRGDGVYLSKRNGVEYGDQGRTVHEGIRVSRTSRFAHKGGGHKGGSIHRRRRKK